MKRPPVSLLDFAGKLRRWAPVLAGAAGFALAAWPASLRADYLDDIGYRSLVSELALEGVSLPTGAGVSITQVEASESTSSYAYLANQSYYTGVTITNASASAYTATISGHATTVGSYLYGDASMGSGITSVTAYLANHWIGSGSLNASSATNSRTAPKTESSDVANHSWVGTTGTASYDQIILNRLDYQIERDDYVAVVGVNNGSTAQNLLASAYNVISVGLSNGGHASGSSTEVNTGVTYPLIVVPLGATSWATPVVSSAAALLIETARASASTSTNGAKSEAVKAILLAGATKSEFSSWTRSDTSPLDSVYGAGELNIQNSYHIMTAGEQAAGVVATTGWDYSAISLNAETTYSFSLSGDASFSAILTWNAIYSGSNYNALSLSLANLDLYLYAVGLDGSLVLVQQSLATSNVEALWLSDLAGGNYVIKVVYGGNTSGSLTSASYALAWQSTLLFTTVPEPRAVGICIAGGLVAIAAVRRRRRGAALRVRAPAR